MFRCALDIKDVKGLLTMVITTYMIRHIFKKSAFIVIILCVSGLIFLSYRLFTGNIKVQLLKLSKEIFKAEVSVKQVYLRFPVCLELKDIKIDEDIDIPSVRVYPNPASFFIKNKLIISKVSIINPVIRIKKEDVAKWNTVSFQTKEKEKKSESFFLPDFLLSRIYIHNGTIIYDKGGRDELEFINIKGDVETPGFYFSKDGAVNFAITGFLKNRETDFLSPLKINGRADPAKMIKARLQVDDVKVGTLGRLYDLYLSRVMKEGRLDLNSDIQISESNLIAKCLLEGEDIILKKGADAQIESPLLASFILFFSFKNKLVKLKDIQGNFFNIIFKRS